MLINTKNLKTVNNLTDKEYFLVFTGGKSTPHRMSFESLNSLISAVANELSDADGDTKVEVERTSNDDDTIYAQVAGIDHLTLTSTLDTLAQGSIGGINGLNQLQVGTTAVEGSTSGAVLKYDKNTTSKCSVELGDLSSMGGGRGLGSFLGLTDHTDSDNSASWEVDLRGKGNTLRLYGRFNNQAAGENELMFDDENFRLKRSTINYFDLDFAEDVLYLNTLQMGIGFPAGVSLPNVDAALMVKDMDIEVVNSLNGVILESPNGTRWRITIDNSGALNTATV